ncbi:K02A2.6-like [Cordylochernes scorpioides]|uniref:K02A2.6-like n=1 Tax=Cordylochernes scorpioides TaxID=51811 RepID=A0ABY6KK13_9ARAC|nr:K02A2.6-like [Cordylochernes scorpioides]
MVNLLRRASQEETKLNQNLRFNIKDYTTLRKDRPGKFGGGLAVLIKTLEIKFKDIAYNQNNGRQFDSGEFEQFTKMNGIRHTKTSPYNPSTNGLAERYVREFKNLLRKNNGKDDLETNLQRFLFAHRAFRQTVIKEFPRGTANEEKFKIKILEFNTKMGNPREVFHEATRACCCARALLHSSTGVCSCASARPQS